MHIPTPNSQSVIAGLPDLKRTWKSKMGLFRTSSTRTELLKLKENITSVKSVEKTKGDDKEVISEYEKIRNNLNDLEAIREKKGGELTRYKSKYLASLITVAQTMLDERRGSYFSSLAKIENESRDKFKLHSNKANQLAKAIKNKEDVKCTVEALRKDVHRLKEKEFVQENKVNHERERFDEARENLFSSLGVPAKKIRVDSGKHAFVITDKNAIHAQDACSFANKIDSVCDYLGELNKAKKSLVKLRKSDSEIKNCQSRLYDLETSFEGGKLIKEMDQDGFSSKGSGFDAKNARAKKHCEAAMRVLAEKGIDEEYMSIKESDFSIKGATKYADTKMYRYYQIQFHTEDLQKDMEKCKKKVGECRSSVDEQFDVREFDAFAIMVGSLGSGYREKLGSDIATCSPSFLKGLKPAFSEGKKREILRVSKEILAERKAVEQRVNIDLRSRVDKLDRMQGEWDEVRSELEYKKARLMAAEKKRELYAEKPLKKLKKNLSKSQEVRNFWQQEMEDCNLKRTQELERLENKSLIDEGASAKL